MLDRVGAVLWVALVGATAGFAAGALAGAAVEFALPNAGDVILMLGSLGAVLGLSLAFLVVAYDARR